MKFELIIDREHEEVIKAIVKSKNELTDKIEEMVLNYNGVDKVIGYDETEIIYLDSSDIDCFSVIENKTYAIDHNNRRYQVKYRLYELEKILPANFIKINKSCIGNRERILKFKLFFNGSVNVLFKSGYEDYVSRRCFVEIKRSLTK